MSDLEEIQTLFESSKSAYAAKDYARALALLDAILEKSPQSPEGLGARHLRAMAYEFGNTPQGVALGAALEDFRVLSDKSDVVGSTGLVGSARVLCQIDFSGRVDEIRSLCLQAVEVDRSTAAMMLLGFLSLEADKDVGSAKKWFMSAFRGGSLWGLRYLAAAYSEEGKWHLGLLVRFAALVLAPAYALTGRAKMSPYH